MTLTYTDDLAWVLHKENKFTQLTATINSTPTNELVDSFFECPRLAIVQNQDSVVTLHLLYAIFRYTRLDRDGLTGLKEEDYYDTYFMIKTLLLEDLSGHCSIIRIGLDEILKSFSWADPPITVDGEFTETCLNCLNRYPKFAQVLCFILYGRCLVALMEALLSDKVIDESDEIFMALAIYYGSNDSPFLDKNWSVVERMKAKVEFNETSVPSVHDLPTIMANKKYIEDSIIFYEKVQQIVTKVTGGGLELLGSAVSGLFLKNSDIDCSISSDVLSKSDHVRELEKIAGVLKAINEPGLSVDLIDGAKVPIIKLRYKNVMMDISCENVLGRINSNFLYDYLGLDPRAKALACIIKNWAIHEGVISIYQGLNSYSCTLLVLNFLLCRPKGPVLPNLQTEGKQQIITAKHRSHNVWYKKPKPNKERQYTVKVDENFPALTPLLVVDGFHPIKCTVTELLKEFFDYYAFKFNWFAQVVCPRKAPVVPLKTDIILLTNKLDKYHAHNTQFNRWKGRNTEYWNALVIEDPLECDRCYTIVGRDRITSVWGKFMRMALLLQGSTGESIPSSLPS